MSLAGDSWIIYWPTKLYLTVYRPRPCDAAHQGESRMMSRAISELGALARTTIPAHMSTIGHLNTTGVSWVKSLSKK